MAQNINLLNPALLPRPEPLPVRRMAWLLALAALGCALWAGWQMRQAALQRQAHAAAEQAYRAEREALARAIAALPPALSANALAQQAAALEARLSRQQEQLQQLAQGRLEPARRHSALLRLLASDPPAGIWLTEIQAGPEPVRLQGQALQAPALRDWMQRLGQAPYFEGRPLEHLQAERLQAEAASASASAAAGAAPLPARLKFQLASGAAPAGARP